ncbi:MAG: CCA tRNA nucleotidyltransferase [Lachnospiraceae bacterium]|nr:CCA tRNA nucleotidyltransferase [Lachnospiraceae bacterium]
MHIELPPQVQNILRILREAGFEAYIVGGCVRDALLAREPGDWDITTSASPQEVKALFRRTIDTGIQHGTVTVLMGGNGYEVTTYRVDGVYEDGRHPKQVSFTRSLAEDLKRRDFTINAMAYHPEEGIVDLHGGLADLAHGVIRAVGDPRERFQEDALRILRAVRFSAQLNFTIEEETLAAIRAFAPRLTLISRERIQVECHKLLLSPHPERFLTLYETGITAILFPEFDRMMETPQNHPYHCYSVGLHTIETLKAVPADPVLRWAALLHDVGKLSTHTVDEIGIDHFHGHAVASAGFARRFLRDLRFDNRTVRLVTLLVRYHDYKLGMSEEDLRRTMYRVGAENFPRLLTLRRADAAAKSPLGRERLLPCCDRAEALYAKIVARGDCTSLKDLAVTGQDLIAAGFRPGKKIGETLEQLLELVLVHPEYNTKEELMHYITSSPS